MQQRLSKLEAAQRLGVSPSTLDRMIRRGSWRLSGRAGGIGPRCGSWRLGYPAMHPVANPSMLDHLATGEDQEGRLVAFHFTSWLTGSLETRWPGGALG